MIRKFRKPVLALSISLLLVFFVTSPAIAAMVQSRISQQQGQQDTYERRELETIQRALENKIVQEKLSAYGLTREEVDAKLKTLTDQQRHLLAQASEKVLAGGDGLGAVIAILVIVLLVIVIMKLLNKEIVIK
ncbi:MAG: PA2779 family protein [Syntrophales bacterium]|jgi:predicted PurR-regulated permease PerM|nr:PA2779 family protein [Syntrophales bacterium]